MSKSNTYEADILKLYFQAVGIANIADNAAGAPAANIFVSLYTADPTDTASVVNEAAYTGYARQSVVRSAAGWTVSGDTPTQVSPVAVIDFPVCSAVPGGPITHFGVSKLAAGVPEYIGTVTPNITMAVGVIPRLKTTSTITED